MSVDLATLAYPRHLHGPNRSSVIVATVAAAEAALADGYTVDYDENRGDDEPASVSVETVPAATVPDEPSVPMPRPRGRPKKVVE